MTAIPPIDPGVVILSRERLREWAEVAEKGVEKCYCDQGSKDGGECIFEQLAREIREAANGGKRECP